MQTIAVIFHLLSIFLRRLFFLFVNHGVHIVRLTLLVVTISIAYYGYNEFPKQIQMIKKWSERQESYLYEANTGDLFRALLKHRLLYFSSESFHIAYPPSDLVLQRKTLLAKKDSCQQDGNRCSDGWPKEIGEQEVNLLIKLYQSNAGNSIQQKIAEWNRTHQLAAIRDNSYISKASNKTQLFVRKGSYPSLWSAKALVGEVSYQSEYAVRSASSVSYDSKQFGFFSWGIGQQAVPDGDWLSVMGTGKQEELIQFRRPVPTETDKTLIVDIIGYQPQISGATEAQEREVLCKNKYRDENCTTITHPSAFRYYLKSDGTSEEISITVKPFANIPKKMQAYRSIDFLTKSCDVIECSKEKGWHALSYVHIDTLALLCRKQQTQKRPECLLKWELEKKLEGSETTLITLKTADDIFLTDDKEQGIISDQAVKLGLAPLVGLGSADRYALSAALRRNISTANTTVKLTLRADIQKIAQDALKETLKKKAAFLPEKYANKRRAVLLLMDVHEESTRGDVLAVAALPQLKATDSVWNTLGFDFWQPNQSRLAPIAWGRINSHYAPGSTFKAVTALNLIQKVVAIDEDETDEGEGNYMRTLRGVRNPKDAPALPLPDGVKIKKEGNIIIPTKAFKEVTNTPCWQKKSGEIVDKTEKRICNFTNETHRYPLTKTSVSGCPSISDTATDNGKGQYGLCEATAVSINTWFIATALGLNHTKSETDNTIQKPLSAMADRFLANKAERDLSGLTTLSSTSTQPSNARYQANPFLLGINGKPEKIHNPLFTLAQNSIGQDVQASPLAITTLFASIASGCKVVPKLRLMQAKRCLPLFFDNDTNRNTRAIKLMKTYFYPGLNAVVNSSIGTAKGVFKKEFAKYIYAKTGTATTTEGNEKLNTAWFSGWVEAEGTGNFKRKIAFACMITHGKAVVIGGKKKDPTGGRLCAPAIKAAIDRLRAYKPKAKGAL